MIDETAEHRHLQEVMSQLSYRLKLEAGDSKPSPLDTDFNQGYRIGRLQAFGLASSAIEKLLDFYLNLPTNADETEIKFMVAVVFQQYKNIWD